MMETLQILHIFLISMALAIFCFQYSRYPSWNEFLWRFYFVDGFLSVLSFTAFYINKKFSEGFIIPNFI